MPTEEALYEARRAWLDGHLTYLARKASPDPDYDNLSAARVNHDVEQPSKKGGRGGACFGESGGPVLVDNTNQIPWSETTPALMGPSVNRWS